MTDCASPDVIVIGAGFAGLTTARELVRAGQKVLLLEARDRVGGRVHSIEMAGLRLDIGGRYLGRGQTEALALAKEFDVTFYPPQVDGQMLQSLNGRIVSIDDEFSGLISKEVGEEYERVAEQLEEMAQTLPAHESWNAPNALDWDSMTAEAWVRAHTQHPETVELLRGICIGLVSAEMYEVSFLALLWYIRTSDGMYNAVDFENGLLKHLVKGSMHQLSMRLAESLADQLKLNSPVFRIEQDEQGVRVLSDSGTYTASHVIVAISPMLAGRITYAPALSPMRDTLMQKFAHGRLASILVAYERPFWCERGLSGMVSGDADSWATNVLHVTPPGQPHGVLSCFVEPSKIVQFAAFTDDERKALILRDLVRYFGDEAATPIAYAEVNWTTETYTRGGYGWSLPPGALTMFGHTLRKPEGRVHWAGTETAEMFAGYIEGAIRSGKRAAHEILEKS
ncbi:MAG: FAD-dependent oxidoreductase [Chloroflexota bacterium]